MTTLANTGYRPVDFILGIARNRGLNVRVHDDAGDGAFVVAEVNNRGLGGSLNECTVILYVSVNRSKAGRFVGGHRYPLIGKDRNYSRHEVGRSLRYARRDVETMFVAAEYRTDWDRAREAKERESYERLRAHLEGSKS